MNCNQCGKEIDVSKWKHCTGCGASLYDEKAMLFAYNVFRSRRALVVIGIIFFGIISYLLYSDYRHGKELAEKKNEIDTFMASQNRVSAEWKAEDKVMPLVYLKDMGLGELKIASQAFASLKVELEVEGITEKKIQTFDIKPETRVIKLGADFSKEGLAKLRNNSATGRIKISVYRISDQKEDLILQDEKDVFFNSLKEIVWKKEGTDNTNQVLRLVNKEDPAITELVRKAAKHVKMFGGEEEAMLGMLGDEDEIKAQVQAIFYAMQKDYSVRYIMSPFSYNGIEIQKIREPRDVLETKSGICIDLSLLMVAAFENIGLNPVLVFLDNHVWPGVELGQETNKFFFIESTALTKSPQEAVSIAQENWKTLQRKDVTVTYNLVRLVNVRSENVFPVRFE